MNSSEGRVVVHHSIICIHRRIAHLYTYSAHIDQSVVFRYATLERGDPRPALGDAAGRGQERRDDCQQRGGPGRGERSRRGRRRRRGQEARTGSRGRGTLPRVRFLRCTYVDMYVDMFRCSYLY